MSILSDAPSAVNSPRCCPEHDPMPCLECVQFPDDDAPADYNIHTLPTDLDGTDWDDEHIWNTGPDPAFAEFCKSDPDALALEAVSGLRADWLADRPRDPLHDAEDFIIETLAEADARHRAEHLARVRALLHPTVNGLQSLPNLAGLVEAEAAKYRAIGGAFGDFLAGQLDALAFRIRLTDASSPEDFLDRVEALEADARLAWYEAGLEEGRRLDARPAYID